MLDFLSFKTMITPTLIRLSFLLGSVLSFSIGLGLAFVGIGSGASFVILVMQMADGTGGAEASATSAGLATVAYVLFVLLIFWVVIPVAIRLWCELTILFFRMNETLDDISKKLGSTVDGRVVVPGEEPELFLD